MAEEKDPNQQELFPDHIQEKLPFKGWIEYKMRGEENPLNLHKPYEKITVPDWVKEHRNRDTDSNLE